MFGIVSTIPQSEDFEKRLVRHLRNACELLVGVVQEGDLVQAHANDSVERGKSVGKFSSLKMR